MLPQLSAAVRVFFYTQPTDMRKSFDALEGMVREHLGQDPLSGHLFLFLNRRRDRVKLLLWDRDGLVIWYKTLEAEHPHSFLFTESGGNPNNLACWLVAAGGMDSLSKRNGPRRRPMFGEIAVSAPPRAQCSPVGETPPSCGVN
jgi:IS66 Orf2 like protein